jgi:hypothetical protein
MSLLAPAFQDHLVHLFRIVHKALCHARMTPLDHWSRGFAVFALVRAHKLGIGHKISHRSARFGAVSRLQGGPPDQRYTAGCRASERDDSMTPMINASHLDVEVRAELTELQDVRWRQQDARAGISPAPPPKPPAPAPKPKPKPGNAVVKKPATKTPAPRTQKPAPSGSAQPAPTPELPPGAVIVPPGGAVLSADELQAVDFALEFFTAHHPA